MIFELSATSYNRRIGILYTKKIKLLKRINGVLAGSKIFDQYIFNLLCKSDNSEKKIIYWKKKIFLQNFLPQNFFHFFFESCLELPEMQSKLKK